MSSHYRNTTLVSGIAVAALVFTGTAWAGAQEVGQQQAQGEQRAQEANERAQVRRVGPAIYSLGGNFIVTGRSGGIASRALASAEEIGLTEEQEAQIRQLQREGRRAEIRRNADKEIAEMDLEEMMSMGSSDLDTIEQKMREVANLEVDEKMADLRLDRSVEAVLTAAQRDELDEISPGRVLFERQRRR